jgi:hypothetical protein
MGKYRSSSRIRTAPKTDGPHAIWRGIGCFMMLIIPVISIAAGSLTVSYGIDHKWPLPYELMGTPQLPGLFYKSNGLMTILGPLLSIKNLYAIATISIMVMIFLSGIISLIYAVVYRMTGPSRYGPTDAPPPKIKTKKYSR